MATETSEQRDACAGVGDHPQALALPERLARLINPVVRAERAAVVAARMSDKALGRVHQRRCAEIIANHLLETVAND